MNEIYKTEINSYEDYFYAVDEIKEIIKEIKSVSLNQITYHHLKPLNFVIKYNIDFQEIAEYYQEKLNKDILMYAIEN